VGLGVFFQKSPKPARRQRVKEKITSKNAKRASHSRNANKTAILLRSNYVFIVGQIFSGANFANVYQ